MEFHQKSSATKVMGGGGGNIYIFQILHLYSPICLS